MVMTIRVLIAIPHVFAPKKGSIYSSQTASKKSLKQTALGEATIGNLSRLGQQHWIHASLGKGKSVVTRDLKNNTGVQLTIELVTPANSSLADSIPEHPSLLRLEPNVNDLTQVPMVAARQALEKAEDYDLIGYMEDDLVIESPEFFLKILWMINQFGVKYAFLPHRCEHIPGRGDVILSGDPDGGRPDLFWDTGETLDIPWPLGHTQFYRATNPHSGCWFLSQQQALALNHYWSRNNWKSDYQLSGPLEQAASGILLPVFHIMKPKPEDYKFLMIRHLDSLWKRHDHENGSKLQELL